MSPAAFDAVLDEIAERVARKLRIAPSEYVPEDELVSLIGSRLKAKKLIKSGAIEGSVVGRRLVAKRDALNAFLERHRPVAATKPERFDEEQAANESIRRALG